MQNDKINKNEWIDQTKIGKKMRKVKKNFIYNSQRYFEQENMAHNIPNIYTKMLSFSSIDQTYHRKTLKN